MQKHAEIAFTYRRLFAYTKIPKYPIQQIVAWDGTGDEAQVMGSPADINRHKVCGDALLHS